MLPCDLQARRARKGSSFVVEKFKRYASQLVNDNVDRQRSVNLLNHFNSKVARMTDRIRDLIRWTWLGPLLVTLILAMSAAWAINMDRRMTRQEEITAELIKANGEIRGSLTTIVEQNRSQDSRTTQISSRIDMLISMHISERVNQRR